MSTSRKTQHRRCSRLADTGGFTLIEVLVAFTVLATLLSVLFRGVVQMRAGAYAFDDHTGQQLVARAVLEDALAKRSLAAGRYSGTREGRRWTLVAQPLDLSGQMPAPEPDQSAANGPTQATPDAAGTAPVKAEARPLWRPQRLIVRIENRGRPLEIETIRLVKAEKGG